MAPRTSNGSELEEQSKAVLWLKWPVVFLLAGVVAVILFFTLRSRARHHTNDPDEILRSFDSGLAYEYVECRASKSRRPYPWPHAKLVELGPRSLPNVINCYERPFITSRISKSLLRTRCLEVIVSIGTREAFYWLGSTLYSADDGTASKIRMFVDGYREDFTLDIPIEFLECLSNAVGANERGASHLAELFDSLCRTQFGEQLKRGKPPADVSRAMSVWLVAEKEHLVWDADMATFRHGSRR